ncbi:TetR/AcrR family transcriptional regulator [Streptomyces sp. NPDC057697]|uniref:TetR/AcrR family transcriptional regulator n=1 Tax=Streptomyces sp. NPDC057697 TaxID=3346219 RepID=UPI003676A252
MSTRARILDVAARLVAESPDGDISTRAVCEAAQVGAPALYRHFGDKEGLLSAVVDHGFDAYLATKRERGGSADPVEDLRRGWDGHVEFALRNPNLYRLMNSPAMRTPPASALESHRILTGDLERAAAAGKLRLAPGPAARMVMSANVGVALMLVARPATFSDDGMSHRVRDAVHAAVLTPEAFGASPGEAAADGPRGPGPAESGPSVAATGPEPRRPVPSAGPGPSVPSAAVRLNALLRRTPAPSLSPAEGALLTEWLDRLSNAPGTG